MFYTSDRKTPLLLIETSMHTYSLSEESFGYNYGCLKNSVSHACREKTVLKNGESCTSAAMTVTFRLVCRYFYSMQAYYKNSQRLYAEVSGMLLLTLFGLGASKVLAYPIVLLLLGDYWATPRVPCH